MKLLLAVLVVILSCAKVQEEKGVKGWQYYYDLGMSSLAAKNYSEAITNFFLASQIAPNEPKTWNSLGLAYMEVLEYDKAEHAFRKAIEVDKRFTEAQLNLGILYFRKRDYEKALNELRSALADEAFPHKHVAFYYLARIYKAMDNQNFYLENLRKATLYNPMFIDAQLELASAYEELKDYRLALDVYRNLLSNGIVNPQIEFNMAWLMFHLEDYENAKLLVRRIIENRQTETNLKLRAYNLLSQILIREQERLISKRDITTVEKLTDEPRLRQEAQEIPERELVKKEQITLEKPQDQAMPDKSAPSASKPPDAPKERVIRIQLGAFSSEDRAKVWKDRLEKGIGIKDLMIVEQFGTYRVLYGNFKTRAEAEYQLEKLRNHNIYGFIVQD